MDRPSKAVTITPGGVSHVPAVLALLDDAARWLVARGRPGQWGTDVPSANRRFDDRVTAWARGGELHLAVADGRVVGALAVGSAPAHVPQVEEPELYVNLLVTDRALAGNGVGTTLLDHARSIARRRGLDLLRVDCYGGDDRALVGYYERQGFTATDTFTVDLARGPWPGQILEQRLTPAQ